MSNFFSFEEFFDELTRTCIICYVGEYLGVYFNLLRDNLVLVDTTIFDGDCKVVLSCSHSNKLSPYDAWTLWKKINSLSD